ncbi:MAG: metallophosphoesterase [Pirellulaceae bacterium]|nr:metallophosphoesterase [Pirellulaceae bacterium]MDP7014930.1 metallophosphoesterase [Pirellulaceae bacterium]
MFSASAAANAVLLLLAWAAITLGVVGAVRADEFPPAPAGTFSLVVIPDTQHYKIKKKKVDNDAFESYVRWTVNNLRKQRVAFVSHVGDVVDVNERKQWAFARQTMDLLHGRVPYGISVGNHDMAASGDSSLFQEMFAASRFARFDWYGGYYRNPDGDFAHSGNNANSFQLFTAEGLDFIILHLECNAPDDVLDWADDILERHALRRAIITTHMGLGPRDRPKTPEDFFQSPKGRMTWKKCHGKRGNSPQKMWEKCFRKHANLFLICCGDQSRTQTMRQTARGVQGNFVHEVLSDYGEQGMRVMRFVPARNRIEVRTWNSLTNKFCTSTEFVPRPSEHQFSLLYKMTTSP